MRAPDVGIVHWMTDPTGYPDLGFTDEMERPDEAAVYKVEQRPVATVRLYWRTVCTGDLRARVLEVVGPCEPDFNPVKGYGERLLKEVISIAQRRPFFAVISRLPKSPAERSWLMPMLVRLGFVNVQQDLWMLPIAVGVVVDGRDHRIDAPGWVIE